MALTFGEVVWFFWCFMCVCKETKLSTDIGRASVVASFMLRPALTAVG